MLNYLADSSLGVWRERQLPALLLPARGQAGQPCNPEGGASVRREGAPPAAVPGPVPGPAQVDEWHRTDQVRIAFAFSVSFKPLPLRLCL